MEGREIVVKRIEIGGDPAPGAPGGPGAGSGRSPLVRALLRIVGILLVVGIAVPAVVLGGACIVAAVVVALVAWAIRRIVGK